MKGASMKKLLSYACLVVISLTATATGFAQPLATSPVRWIVPYAAGGGQDFIARTIAQQLSIDMGRPVLVDNKPGGNGVVAANDLMRSAPDGLTLMSVDNGHLIFNPVLYKNLGYNAAKDMALVTTTGRIPLLLLAGPSSDAKTAREFLGQVKAAPGKYSYASVGAGSPHHIAMELLKQRAKLHIVHIPYRGGAPAIADLAGGQVPVMMGDPTFAMAFIKAGKVRPLAVADSVRLPQLPDVPTFAEIGVDGMEAAAFTAVVTTAGTSTAVVDSLNQAIVKVLRDAAVAKKLSAAGVEPSPLTPAQFSAMVQSESKRWHKVIVEQKITVD